MRAMTRPIHIFAAAPAGFAFDAIFPIHNNLRLAKIVGVAFVHFGWANVPERGPLDFRAFLEEGRPVDLDMRRFFAQVTNRAELVLPRLRNLDVAIVEFGAFPRRGEPASVKGFQVLFDGGTLAGIARSEEHRSE